VAAIEIENNSYTTLDELEKLEIRESLSAPLEVLLNGLKNERKEKRGIICEELNASQMEAVDNGNERVISVISGPPGTGKSFTIANLAAEKVSKGQSVLITSKNKEALDVIEDKIRSNIGIENLCVNPTKDATFWELRDYLEDILGRNYKRSNLQFRDVENRFHDLDEFMEEHKALEYRLKSSFEGERTIVDVLNNRKSTARSSLIFKERVLKSRSKIGVPLWESLQEYYKSIETYKEKTLSILQSIIRYKIDENVINKRADLRNYHSFLRSAAVTSQAKEYKESLEAKVDYNVVVDTFPVWLVKANEVSKIIPLEKEIFDVLIIDEASQCDIPSVLPLIHRAKKCIVVGDSKQLNHVSFITNSFESAARRDVVEDKRHLCGHRNRSVLNLAEETLDPMEVTQLNEHFRSQFPLIAFSNSEFYNSELNILTKRPISTNRHIEFIQTAGKRSKGYNQVEVDLLIANVRKRIEDEEKLPEHLKSTIGILSPFRKQVDRIFSVLKKEFKLEEIQAHKILVGTAFTFQGNERDEMHLTLALDNGSVGGSFTFLNRADVFNVSVTRARNVQYIYHSFDREVLKDNTTISNFFSFYAKEMDDLKGKDLKDAFCDDVEDFFKEKGCDCWRAFEISGVSIDLLVKNGDDFVGIDLIGFPGEMQDYYSLERYKMIERGKIKLFPMAYSMWKGNKEKCKAALEQLIEPKSEI
jgi:superfamily I DNA and/or RNA helicase